MDRQGSALERMEGALHPATLGVLWFLMTASAQIVARPALLWLRVPWGGLVSGLLSGLLQWTLLAPILPRSGLWIVATALGHMAGSLLPGRLSPLWAAVAAEALLGLAQWAVLRRSARLAGLWPIVRTLVAWPAADLGLRAAAWLMPANSPLVAHALAGAAQGALTGAATALLVVAIFSSRPAASPPGEDATL